MLGQCSEIEGSSGSQGNPRLVQHHTDTTAQTWKQDSAGHPKDPCCDTEGSFDPSCSVYTYVGVTKVEDRHSTAQDTSVNMAKITSKGVSVESKWVVEKGFKWAEQNIHNIPATTQ